MNKPKSVLLEAEEIVNGDRQKDYGTPHDNHSLTASYWSILFGIPISAEQVCKANILQKISRSHNAYKRDNYTDIAGFAENANQCAIATIHYDHIHQGGLIPDEDKGFYPMGDVDAMRKGIL